MPEAANTRLRAVTDFVERDPWPKLRRYRVLIGAGMLVLSGVLWITSPSPYQASALIPFFPAIMLSTEGLQEWLRRRLQRRADHAPANRLLDQAPIVLQDLRAPVAPFVAPAVFFLAAGFALLAEDSLWWGLGASLTGAFLTLVLTKRLLRPDGLKVGREGFGGFNAPVVPWRQASAFYVKTEGDIDLVAYRRLDPAKPELTGRRAPEVWLHAHGPLSPEKLAELMNAARARWG